MKDPAFLFYPGDWYRRTMGMSPNGKDAYLSLILFQWEYGSFTLDQAADLLGDRMTLVWLKVKKNFILVGKNEYIDPYFQEIFDQRKKYVESRRQNRLGQNKKRDSNHMIEHMNNHIASDMSNHITNHMCSHMDNEDEVVSVFVVGDEERARGKNDKKKILGKQTKEFIAAYCEEFKFRRGCNPPIGGKQSGIAKRLVKDLGLDKAISLVQTYLQMPDQWFITREYDLPTFEANLNKIVRFAEKIGRAS